MTGREFLNSLDNRHFALMMVGMADTCMDVLPIVMLVDNDARRRCKKEGDKGITAIKASITLHFLENEIEQELIDALNRVESDNIAEE